MDVVDTTSDKTVVITCLLFTPVQWRVEPLEDNIPTDETTYLISVETGLKSGAGTKSGVWFVLFGRYGDTGVRALASVSKKVGNKYVHELHRYTNNGLLMLTSVTNLIYVHLCRSYIYRSKYV